jgi:sodium/bile acid cotransporter 7
VIPESLADGLVICASLPLSISMVAVLTKSAGGDEASAVFHAAFGNFLGVFLSPALILGYLGVSGSIDMGKVLYQLILRVIVPVILGQILQKCSPSIVAFSNKYKRVITSVKEYALVFIIYTIFCQTFANDTNDSDLGDVFIMIAIIFFLLSGFMIMSWLIFRFLYRDEPKLRVMALYGTTHKTISIGIPLISAMYEGDPRIALYSLPLLIWYIMQLVLGTLIAPKLRDWVQTEQKRLGRVDELEAESDEESPAPSVNEESPEDDLETSQTN